MGLGLGLGPARKAHQRFTVDPDFGASHAERDSGLLTEEGAPLPAGPIDRRWGHASSNRCKLNMEHATRLPVDVTLP